MTAHPSSHLDVIPEADLLVELALRADRRAHGLCDYCSRKPSDPPCRYNERHYALACRECGKLLSKRSKETAPIGGHLLCKACFRRERK